MTSSSTSTTQGTFTTCTPSSSVYCFRKEKVSKGTGSPCFLTAVNPMYTHLNQEEVQYDLKKPRVTVNKNNRRIHQNTVYWCNLKLAQSKGLQFCQTRSNAITLLYTWRLDRSYTAQYTCLQGYREPYSRRICIMDVRILLIPKRANPPTMKSNRASGTGKTVARGTIKLVAVTLITELTIYFTQQIRKKTLIAKKS